MAIDNKQVNNIAHLARLKISDSEIDNFRSELSNILALVEKMSICDTGEIQPMTHPFDATLRLREDKLTEQNERDKFQALAPQASEGLYLVPKVID